MSRPHDAMAAVYDEVYQQDFGRFYNWLTDTTVELVRQLLPAGGAVVEFGAGTGRMALPLAQAGYRVTAVEPSEPMLQQLRNGEAAADIQCVHSTMQDYSGSARHDLALCVFTVVIYLLDQAALRAALLSACRSLKPGGQLLIDVPSRELFHNRRVRKRQLQRTVTIKPLGEDLFDYTEKVVLDPHQAARSWEDRFTIRCWSCDQVLQVAAETGLQFERECADVLQDSGSRYLLFRAPAAVRTRTA